MKIIKATETFEQHWTAKKLMKKLKDGDINVDIDIQRQYVWKRDIVRKSAFIRSMFLDRSIPPLYFNEIDGKFDLIDGKQRILTVENFTNNSFALAGLEMVVIENDNGETEELDINGMYYRDLPEEIQDAILSYNFSVNLLSNAAQEEISDIFYNLNNGKPIGAAVMNRIKAKSKDQISRLAKHALFKEALTNTAIEGHVNDDLVAKTHALLYADQPSTETKWIRPYMRTVEISSEQESEMQKIFDHIVSVHKLIEDISVQKKIYRRTHLISIVPIIARAINEGKTDEQIMNWMVTFFIAGKKATTSSKYNSAAGAGSGSQVSVSNRLLEVESSYVAYFNGQKGE